jgi:hypothetical protein
MYIHCPDCDAVREITTAACPECGRCANCGEKIAVGSLVCECGFPGDEIIAGSILRHYGIPDEYVEQEKSKWQRRKKLRPLWLALRILLLGLCIFLGVATAISLLADANGLVKTVLYVPVVCLVVLLYWVFFIGVGRILLWIAKKLMPLHF